MNAKFLIIHHEMSNKKKVIPMSAYLLSQYRFRFFFLFQKDLFWARDFKFSHLNIFCFLYNNQHPYHRIRKMNVSHDSIVLFTNGSSFLLKKKKITKSSSGQKTYKNKLYTIENCCKFMMVR
jgi:hypothetical protein